MSDVVVYNDGELELKVSVNEETIWLTQKQLVELFEVTKQNISLHINNIFKEDELNKNSTVKFFLTVQQEGKRKVERNLEHYNLDMIISLGYRVNSKKATKFRQWATSVLKNYIQNGYAINTHKITEQRLLNLENDVGLIKSQIKNNTLELKQGIFFDGQIYDAYAFVSELIKKATQNIVIIDNYIDDTVLTLLAKNTKVTATIYTKTITKQLSLDEQKYNAQYKNLTLKEFDISHDRFLIIDDEIYHIGASLKDLGKKWFAFSKMDSKKCGYFGETKMSEIKQGYKQTKVGIIPEDWEVVKLGKVTKINPNNKNLPENFIYIDLESVVKGKLLKQNFISKYEAPSRAQRVLKKNDILFQMVRPYQMNNLFFEFDGNYVASTGYAQIRTNQSDKYIFQYIHLKRFVDKVLEKCTGSNYPAINSSDLSDILIILPPLKEQEKIAEILTTWDEAITKQTELLRAKELLKKALMQKLLSGEVRFSGFGDEWEEVRLGEIGEFKTSSIDKIINENESLVNLINYMDVYRNKHIDKNFRCSKTSLKEEQYEKVNLKKGDILFTPSSETPDDIGHSAVIIEDLPNTVYSYHLVRFRPKKSIDLKFSGYVFNNIDILKEFAKRANGSTRFTLSIKDFNETKAKLPSLLEQHKIAEVLSLVDDEINLLKNELEELKLQKKALMQKLLTGEVRVKV